MSRVAKIAVWVSVVTCVLFMLTTSAYFVGKKKAWDVCEAQMEDKMETAALIGYSVGLRECERVCPEAFHTYEDQ